MGHASLMRPDRPLPTLLLVNMPLRRDPNTAAPNHSNRVLFDEAAMVNGIAVYSAMALRHLTQTTAA